MYILEAAKFFKEQSSLFEEASDVYHRCVWNLNRIVLLRVPRTNLYQKVLMLCVEKSSTKFPVRLKTTGLFIRKLKFMVGWQNLGGYC